MGKSQKTKEVKPAEKAAVLPTNPAAVLMKKAGECRTEAVRMIGKAEAFEEMAALLDTAQ